MIINNDPSFGRDDDVVFGPARPPRRDEVLSPSPSQKFVFVKLEESELMAGLRGEGDGVGAAQPSPQHEEIDLARGSSDRAVFGAYDHKAMLPAGAQAIAAFAEAHRREPKGFVLGQEVGTGTPVYLEQTSPHLTIIGGTGTGKSTLLEHMIMDDVAHSRPVIVLDPHEALAPRIISCATPEERERIALLEVWPERPFRLNPLEPSLEGGIPDSDISRLADAFAKIFREDSYRPELARDLNLVSATLAPHNGTLIDALAILLDPRQRDSWLSKSGSTAGVLRSLWQARDLMIKGAGGQPQALLNRLTELLILPTLRATLSSPHSSVPFDDVLLPHDGRLPGVLLVSLPAHDAQLTDRLGTLFLSHLVRRVFERGEIAAADHAHQVRLYIDEYHRFETPAVQNIFTQGRKFGLNVVVAHQTIADADMNAAESQAGGFMVFGLGADARQVARDALIVQRQPTLETRAIALQPIRTILRSSHPRPEVRDAFRQHIIPLLQEIEERDDSKADLEEIAEKTLRNRYGFYPSHRENTPIPPRDVLTTEVLKTRRVASSPHRDRLQQLRRLLQDIDDVFVDVMEGRQSIRTFDLAKRLYRLAIIRCYPGEDELKPDYSISTALWRSPPKEYLFAVITADVAKHNIPVVMSQAYEFLPFLNENLYYRTISEYLGYLSDLSELYIGLDIAIKLGVVPHTDQMKRLLVNSDHYARETTGGTYKDRLAEIRSRLHVQVTITPAQKAAARKLFVQYHTRADDEEQARQAYKEPIDFAQGLNLLCELLSTERVEVATGPRDEPQRTISDLREGLAEQIKQLQPFQAYYRTRAGQRRLEVLPDRTFAEIQPEKIAAVRSRSKQLYGVPLDEPAPSLSADNAVLQQSPPIGRRSRRQ